MLIHNRFNGINQLCVFEAILIRVKKNQLSGFFELENIPFGIKSYHLVYTDSPLTIMDNYGWLFCFQVLIKEKMRTEG